jgi:hypothetical protein
MDYVSGKVLKWSGIFKDKLYFRHLKEFSMAKFVLRLT